MKAIIAKNNLSFTGKDGSLIWNCLEDLKLFKNLTDGQTCLVGYNTSLNLPVLKNRKVVLDPRGSFTNEIVDWCIGGSKTYEKYCHLFTELHISIIDNNEIGDTMFPNLKNLNQDCKIYIHNFK